jgi:LmbE family N-acetylglucosaminyl deacetylase
MKANEFRLMAITAHPDDEAGGFGGTLAHYAGLGVTVDIVCATCGEAGRHRGAATTPAELAALRREEFHRGCAVLGASWQHILDYPDRGLNTVPLLEIGARLVALIRERRPHVVLTFGPEGAYTGHPDHSAISHFATFAFHSAGRPDQFPDAGPPHRPAKLYWLTGPGPMPDYPEVTLSPVSAVINVEAMLERKLQGFETHTTQAPLFTRFRAALKRLGASEYYHLAASLAPPRSALEHDLFEGL